MTKKIIWGIVIVVIIVIGAVYIFGVNYSLDCCHGEQYQTPKDWISHQVKGQGKFPGFTVFAPSGWNETEGPDGKYASWNILNSSTHSGVNIYWPVESCTDSEWKLSRADLYPSREKCISSGDTFFHLVLRAASSSDQIILERIASSFKITN